MSMTKAYDCFANDGVCKVEDMIGDAYIYLAIYRMIITAKDCDAEL